MKVALVKLSPVRVFVHILCRSGGPGVFCKKDVLRNLTKFTGKFLRTAFYTEHLWWLLLIMLDVYYILRDDGNRINFICFALA